MSLDPKFFIKFQWQEEELKPWIQDSELHLAVAKAWDRVWLLLFLSSTNLQVSPASQLFRIPDQFACVTLFYFRSLSTEHKNPNLGMWEMTYRQIKWLFLPQLHCVALNRTASTSSKISIFFTWLCFIPSNYGNLHLISGDWSSTHKTLLSGKKPAAWKKPKLPKKKLISWLHKVAANDHKCHQTLCFTHHFRLVFLLNKSCKPLNLNNQNDLLFWEQSPANI